MLWKVRKKKKKKKTKLTNKNNKNYLPKEEWQVEKKSAHRGRGCQDLSHARQESLAIESHGYR